MYHNVFRYEYLRFQIQKKLHKLYIFDTNNNGSEYAFFPFSIAMCDYRTDTRTDRETPDKASQATQKPNLFVGLIHNFCVATSFGTINV